MGSFARALIIVSGIGASSHAQPAAPWPPNAVAGGAFVVQPGDAVKDIASLVLPDHFTLRFDPSIAAVKWNVASFTFGIGVTIDLSAPGVGAKGLPGPPPPPQPSWGLAGKQGAQGGDGGPGRDGVAFVLVVKTLGTPKHGSLWIKTDGARGGDGGIGGEGQTGGGSTCGGNGGGHLTSGGPGGPGGVGGKPGTGGSNSVVYIEIDSNPTTPEPPAALYLQRSLQCGGSSRPSTANGNDGTIAVWGSVGCSGSGGPAGPGGGGGDEGHADRVCRSLSPHNIVVHGGAHGLPGLAYPTALGIPASPGSWVVVGAQPAITPPPAGASNRERCVAEDGAACALYGASLEAACDPHAGFVARTGCLAIARNWKERGAFVIVKQAQCSGSNAIDAGACAKALVALHTDRTPTACDTPPQNIF